MRVGMLRREVEERGHIARRLRAAREQLDLTLERAAANAGVPLRYARLLEGEKPPDVGVSDDLYLIPFFRRYATALGLSAEELLPDFLGQVQELPPPNPLLLTRTRRPRRSVLRPLGVLLAIAAAVVILVRQAPERADEDRGSDGPAGDTSEVAPAAEPPTAAVAENPPARREENPDGVAMARPPAAPPPAAAAAPAAPAAPAGVAPAGVEPPAGGSAAGAAAAGAPAVVSPARNPTRPPASDTSVRNGPAENVVVGAASSPVPRATPADVASAPASGGRELRIVAAQETWLSLGVDDEPKHNILLQPGETRSWTAARAFTLTVGNAGGVTVSLDGHELPPLGRSGQVVRNLRLPPGDATPG